MPPPIFSNTNSNTNTDTNTNTDSNLFHRKPQQTCPHWLPHSQPGLPTRSTSSRVSSKSSQALSHFPQMSHFLHLSHFPRITFKRRLLLICCWCRRPLFAGGKPSAFAATQIQTQLTQGNINIIWNKYTRWHTEIQIWFWTNTGVMQKYKAMHFCCKTKFLGNIIWLKTADVKACVCSVHN